MKQTRLTRRDFLVSSAAAGGGLTIAFSLSGCEKEQKTAVPASGTAGELPPESDPGQFTPNAWLTINSDDSIIVRVGSSEMGQGTLTGIAMLIAEELSAAGATANVAGFGVGGSVSGAESVVALAPAEAVPVLPRLSRIVTV